MRDAATTIAELQKLVMNFVQERNWRPTPRSIAISICLEAAELLEHFQWDDYPEYTKEKKRINEIKNELVDVLIYCLQFAAANRIDVAGAITKKIARNVKKYPARLFQNSTWNAREYYRIKEAARKKTKGKVQQNKTF